MYFSTLAFLATFPLAFAQGTLPPCASSCVQLPSTCQAQDIKCICSDNSFITNISCCVSQKCSTSDQAAALQFAEQFCQASGVTITQTAASCASTAGPTSASSEPASSSATVASGNSTVSTRSVTGGSASPTGTSPSATGSAGPASTAAAGAVGVEMGAVLGGVLGVLGML